MDPTKEEGCCEKKLENASVSEMVSEDGCSDPREAQDHVAEDFPLFQLTLCNLNLLIPFPLFRLLLGDLSSEVGNDVEPGILNFCSEGQIPPSGSTVSSTIPSLELATLSNPHELRSAIGQKGASPLPRQQDPALHPLVATNPFSPLSAKEDLLYLCFHASCYYPCTWNYLDSPLPQVSLPLGSPSTNCPAPLAVLPFSSHTSTSHPPVLVNPTPLIPPAFPPLSRAHFLSITLPPCMTSGPDLINPIPPTSSFS
ncbi:hypothetical protein NE237_004026 [Protea cynaroides]|uniref:Uncharacterized protein n=1 Tax=Protea cynaroides TaxID=273540 RepID=A0A9Q0KI12_9MAGN|nr:hypothetical protein NE237_004026 [Protea cynaroides]